MAVVRQLFTITRVKAFVNEALFVNDINMKKKTPEDYLFCVKCNVNFIIIQN